MLIQKGAVKTAPTEVVYLARNSFLKLTPMVRFLTAPTVWKIRQIGLIRYEFSFPVVNQLSDEASQPP